MTRCSSIFTLLERERVTGETSKENTKGYSLVARRHLIDNEFLMYLSRQLR